MEECSVCVAVKLRPLVQSESDQGCKQSLSVTPGLPQVSQTRSLAGSNGAFESETTNRQPRRESEPLLPPNHHQIFTGHHEFTYDHVFGGEDGADPDQLYPKCVAPLVEGLFRGYNATVFAYGQTGGWRVLWGGKRLMQPCGWVGVQGT